MQPPKTSSSADFVQGKRSATGPILDDPFESALANEHPWGIRDIGNNAISGILNDPNQQAKAGQKPLPGMDRLPQVNPTQIRKVRTAEFDTYLKTLADVFDRYQFNRAVGLAAATEGTPLLSQADATVTPSTLDMDELTMRLGFGIGSPEKAKSSSTQGLTPSQRTRMLSINAPALDTVPAVFLEPDFNLGNPHTFALVCENADITTANRAESLTTNGVLQDKLSHYLDTVEVHLIKEISRRSTSFFAALSNLQALNQETLSCVAQIHELRNKLAKVSTSSSKKGLEVVRLKRRRGNLGILYGGVKLVAEVQQTQPMIQVLLGAADYVAALDLIEQTSMVLRGIDPAAPSKLLLGGPSTPATASLKLLDHQGSEVSTLTPGVRLTRTTSIVPRALDLRGVRALVNLSGQLAEMSRTIGMVMEAEFVNVVIADVRDTLAAIDTASRVSPRIRGAPVDIWIRNIVAGKYSLQAAVTGAPQTRPAKLEGEEEKLRGRLLPLVLGLLRMDRLGSALQAYKDALMKDIKSMTKKHYPPPEELVASSPLEPGTPSTSTMSRKKEQQSALARQLRGMTFDSFFTLLNSVYITLLHILQRVQIVHELSILIVREAEDRGVVIGADGVQMLDDRSGGRSSVVDGDHPPGRQLRRKLDDDDDDFGSLATLNLDDLPAGSPAGSSRGASPTSGDPGSVDIAQASSTYPQMMSESSDILFAASDLAHVRCAKLIGVRSDQNAMLNPKDFYRLFGATWEFVAAGENLCGRLCFGLKGTMLSQAKAFITHFHDEKSKQIALLVENEQWVQAEVPVDFQHLTDRIVSATAFTPSPSISPSHSVSSDTIDEPEDDDEGDLSSLMGAAAGGGKAADLISESSTAGAKSQRHLTIGGQKFYVVGCVLLFLKMLTEYLQCMEGMPAVTADVLNRVTEILKLFNSRTCQVILGAGAMRSAGLRTITARHIALAAQSLGVVIAVIPHMKNSIRKFIPAKQEVLLSDFDRLLMDYKNHQSELYTKLVSIMNERLLEQSKRLQVINWDNPDPNEFSPADSASVHMVALIKETAKLHRVLGKYLSPDTLKYIMSEVFKSYTRRLEEDLKRLELFSGGGKNRLLIDVQYFIQELSSLDGIDGPGNHLEVVVNNIKIKDRRASMAANAGRGTLPGQGGGGPTSGMGGATRASVEVNRSSAGGAPNAGTPAAGAPGAVGQGKFASAFGRMLRNQNGEGGGKSG
ncbi:Vps54-like protein-domain-containing protein [Blyttiomyces helicus]|uniref:Vacuolar protein sorting-associated protein 54 n=1 Tax=Blyttiomyces helicus TaxID=388810 RepID=A0A4P9WK51_9FUNG|nr:Vps54-like protein-domain-containing protein [Blyttiomyces helicus]|eukprot:RKO92475.1 Vps54-like protein-domain-containing protein [Blyttiomyces helicus]